MATKLKNMRLTSVDLVKAGANQEADICLYKSADAEHTSQEAPEAPTEAEKNIFKRFIDWLRENPTETIQDDDSDAFEMEDPSDLYKSAFTESIQSIIADKTLSDEARDEMITKSVDQYHEKMLELTVEPEPEEEPFIPGYDGGATPPKVTPAPVEKSDRYDEIDEI